MTYFIILIAFFSNFAIPWLYSRLSKFQLKRKLSKSNTLVLSFDDGPSNRLTPLILNKLSKYNIRATFFLLGRNVEGSESLVRKIAAQGHEICSHGYEHLNYWKVSPVKAINDIKKGWQTIDNALAADRRVYPFRPPHGKLTLITLMYLWLNKTAICYWTLVTGDTYDLDKQDIDGVISKAKKNCGDVFLTHDFERRNEAVNENVINTLDRILEMAHESNMKSATISEFMSSRRNNSFNTAKAKAQADRIIDRGIE